MSQFAERLAGPTDRRGRADAERPLQAAFGTALDAIITFDEQGRWLDVNPPAARLFGLPRPDLIGRTFLDFIAPDAEDAFRAVWRIFLNSGYVVAELPFQLAVGS